MRIAARRGRLYRRGMIDILRRPLLWRILFWAALLFALVMALLPSPPHLVLDDLGDKAEHSLAFAVLAVLGAWGYPRASLFRLGERLSFLGAMIEVLQSIPALHRDCDIMDWVTDTVVIVITVGLIALFRRRSAARG